ncbi:hypothetical protein StoSoilB3_42900 (plasmid) [Arthrobacter sp. StoSoilB3]|nr:hypothetical protein StoSoilB3_42900 [Arthrobacter sp. StoSoilB3]
METNMITWSNGTLHVALTAGPDQPVGITHLHPGEAPAEPSSAGTALVEILTMEEGRARASQRYGESALGKRLRHTGHRSSVDGVWHTLEVQQRDPETGVETVTVLRAVTGASALQTRTTVRNTGQHPLHLQAVTSLALPVLAGNRAVIPDNLRLASGTSQWLGENQWTLEPVPAILPDLNLRFHDQDQRGHYLRASTSWSTGGPLPTGALVDEDDNWCWMWQIEHNGGWAWELSETRHALNLTLLGPSDDQHQWLHRLLPQESFTTVPATVALSRTGLEGALEEMTRHRRALRGNAALLGPAVVYNDFMNTLMGNPSTEKLLPLIEGAAAAGADAFCIDAGWFDDQTDWWDSVGEWEPCADRFPNGLSEVTDAIRARGMAVGMWLEPEVVGVRSPMAQRLPSEAFLQRHGQRVVEHGRYHLDFRHAESRAHLDETVDRLVRDFGVEYLKLDYNITSGPGTDLDAGSAGDGLLGHNRAYLEWLDGVKARHQLTIENCASGAMRQDYALLSRLDLQSTSDQQDLLRYPPIAANSFFSVLPEQAMHWAYPQPEMTDEQLRFTLATGMLGRMCLSGFVDRCDASQLDIIRTAVTAHKQLLPEITTADAFWPSGIPAWADQWLSVGLQAADRDLVTVWNRGGLASEATLHLPRWADQEISVEWIGASTPMETKWDGSGYLVLSAPTGTLTAGTFAVTGKKA